MLNIKKQITGLYLSSVLGNLSLTGAWVAILAARGYSLVEIGLAETYASNQLIIYRLCGGISTLCAGFALFIGYKAAYGTDILMCAVQICILMSLHEVRISDDNSSNEKRIVGSLKMELVKCFVTSLSFLKNERNTIGFMLCNSFVGAVDVLLLFFLQAKLPEAGMPGWALGLALFFMEMGGILGAKMILKCKKLRYRSVFAITLLLVLSGVLVEHSGMYVIMTLGGFIAAFSDDVLQVRTNTILQDMFPSEQRATLISIESFIFSMIMIVMSPLAGILFSRW